MTAVIVQKDNGQIGANSEKSSQASEGSGNQALGRMVNRFKEVWLTARMTERRYDNSLQVTEIF